MSLHHGIGDHAREDVCELIRVHQNLLHGICRVLGVLEAVFIIVVVIIVVIVVIMMLLNSAILLPTVCSLISPLLILLCLLGNSIYLLLDLQLLEDIVIRLRYFWLRLHNAHCRMSRWYTANHILQWSEHGWLLILFSRSLE